MPPLKRPTILLFVAETTSPGVLYSLYDVLYAVGSVFAEMTIGKPGPESMDVRIVSKDGMPFRCFGNIWVEPHAAIADVYRADAIIVCDMYIPISESPVGRYTEIGDWLRKMHADGALVTSICSGSLVLAEAGLLDGREAATHWAYGELFARLYPQIKMKRNSILCLSAESDRIVTAGGTTAWQDLALYLIARFCGPNRVIETAKVYLLTRHDDGQLPFAAMNRHVGTSDQAIADCQHWIAENYTTPNPVNAMADRAGLNIRTFSRRFRAVTDRSPIDYVQALRVEEAKRLLETGQDAIEEIGFLVGYEDPSSFRRIFRREAGATPAAYRKKFTKLRTFGASA